MRVHAEAGIGELGHAGAAEQNEPGLPQPRDRDRIGCGRRLVGQRLRAGGRDLARNVEQVLDRDRDAGEARGRGPGAAQAVHGGGGGERLRAIDADESARALAGRILNAGEAGLDQRPAGGAAGSEIVGEGFERWRGGHGGARGGLGLCSRSVTDHVIPDKRPSRAISGSIARRCGALARSPELRFAASGMTARLYVGPLPLTPPAPRRIRSRCRKAAAMA